MKQAMNCKPNSRSCSKLGLWFGAHDYCGFKSIEVVEPVNRMVLIMVDLTVQSTNDVN